MSEAEPGFEQEKALAALQARADFLERQLSEVEQRSAMQMREAELKAEAVRAGIVDIDGLRLLDQTAWADGRAFSTQDAADAITQLRRDKPWLFGATHSSSAAAPPPASPARKRLATDMSLEEWRQARSELLRRR